MHETNIKYQDRINIAGSLVHITFDSMAVALSHSTFFTQLLTHPNGLWNGLYIISVTARDFIIRAILYPCLLHRILTPHLKNTSPQIAEIGILIRDANNTAAPNSTLTDARGILLNSKNQFLTLLRINDAEQIHVQ